MDAEIYSRIQKLCAEGDELLEAGETEQAMNRYKAALELVPQPRTDWDASEWIYTALGDACFMQGDFAQAQDHFFNAYTCSGGIDTYVCLRLGQCIFETGDKEKAAEYLLRAYQLGAIDGEEVFGEEDEKYFALIEDKI